MSLGPQCLQCKKRRVKCGSEEPQCKKCAKDGYECPGYTKALKFVAVQPRSKQKKQVAVATVPIPPSSSSSESPDTDVEELPKLSYVLPSLDKRLQTLVESIQYFDTDLSPDLSAVYWTNKQKISLREWVQTPELISNMIIVSALATRVLKQNASSTEMYSYRGKVISGLSRYLRQPKQSTTMSVASLLSILQQEVHLSPMIGYKIHLDAARRIVEQNGGLKNCMRIWPASLDMMTSFVQTDIISTTTTHVDFLQQDRIDAQFDYISAYSDFESELLDSPLPCPLALFEIIIRINEIRVRARDEEQALTALSEEALSILADIRSFSPWIWAHGLSCLPQNSSEEATIEAANEWTTMATCYQAAITIYLIESMKSQNRLKDDDDQYETANELVMQSQERLHHNLKFLFASYPLRKASAERPTLWRFVTWPMTVYAYATTILGRSHKDLNLTEYLPNARSIYDELHHLGTLLGSYSIHRGAERLEALSQLPIPLSWDETWEDSYVFYL